MSFILASFLCHFCVIIIIHRTGFPRDLQSSKGSCRTRCSRVQQPTLTVAETDFTEIGFSNPFQEMLKNCWTVRAVRFGASTRSQWKTPPGCPLDSVQSADPLWRHRKQRPISAAPYDVADSNDITTPPTPPSSAEIRRHLLIFLI